ncbi:MAG: type VI secretion system protein TssA [Planctomycetales bacterium]|nr:type VI secretion system protein TssA [Planctomycetales bacterium]
MTVAEAILDIESLLQEISVDEPCGADLEYDPAFGELERAAEGKPEQQFGDTIVEAEEPDWRVVKKYALSLLDRTRDLRVITYLCQSLIATDGIPAFCEGLQLLSGLLDQQWESVHPLLDPDDDNDPTIRVNSLAALCDRDTTIRLLKKTPIVSSKLVGRFSLSDVRSAMDGDGADSSDDDYSDENVKKSSGPDMAVISAAFQDVDVEELQQFSESVANAIQYANSVESTLTDKAGASFAISFSPLISVLKEIANIYEDQLTRRGVATGSAAEDDGLQTAGGEAGISTGGASVAVQQGLSGEITTRQDVIKAIDKSLDYFKRYEPSSPLPLLLKRAKRLANLDFFEIVKDLAPDAVHQLEVIGGNSGDSSYDDDDGGL